jgi:transcription termination factor Rho
MSVLERSALVDSPLADLHAIASELSIDGFRRLRRAELIDAILDKHAGPSPSEGPDGSASEDSGGSASAEPDGSASAEPVADDEGTGGARRRRGRRGGRGRGASRDAEPGGDAEPEQDGEEEADEAPKPPRARARSRAKAPADDVDAQTATAAESAEDDEPPAKPARSRRARAKASEEEAPEPASAEGGEDEVVQGVVELLPNGSGFVRVAGPDPSDDDVYISSAQVKRCELVSGDAISGPKRAPRRSERFASLVRVETINGRPASEVADSVRFDDLPAALPSVRLKVGSEDPTLKAIEWLTPFGRGSRVTITGATRAGKTEALRRLAAALGDQDDITLSIALAGVRPEEISEWSSGPTAPAVAVSLAASEDVQAAALEPIVDQARRLAARGAHAVVLIDTLDGLTAHAARKLMASARNLVDGGSVTIVATASAPVGGETTVIALDVSLTSISRFPALDLVASGTLRPELLVGDAGADAIARTRAEVSEDDES